MAGESSRGALAPASENIGTTVPRKYLAPPVSRFGTVVLALWPDKPALNLSQRARCSERAANFYITGDRTPSLAAILVVIEEIRGDRRTTCT